jgi:hypothetical protein
MSLFQCCKCGCAEETTLCRYWAARLQDIAPMCSACDPKIGRWHGEFARVSFELRHKDEIEQWLGISLDIPDIPDKKSPTAGPGALLNDLSRLSEEMFRR